MSLGFAPMRDEDIEKYSKIVKTLMESRKPMEANGGNIPIRKIYVNASNCYPQQELEVIDKFEALDIKGIKSVQLSKQRIFFFVMFFTPGGASNALANQRKLLTHYGYKVSAADQWHQPLELPDGRIVWDRRELDNQQVETEDPSMDSSYDESKPSLVDLNDDVLLLIIKRLNLRQCIGIERVCKRLRSLTQLRWASVTSLGKDEFSDFVSDSEPPVMPVDHLREILLRCGATLTYLDLSLFAQSFNLARAAPQISKYCPNLKTLDLSNYHVQARDLFPFAPLFNNLSCLLLNQSVCTLETFSFIMAEGRELETLGMDGLALFTFEEKLMQDAQRTPFAKLKTFNADAMTIPYKFLSAAFPCLTKLTCKDVKMVRGKDRDLPSLPLKELQLIGVESNITLVIEKCPHLEKLEVSVEKQDEIRVAKFVEAIMKLKSLKSLGLLHMQMGEEAVVTGLYSRAEFKGQLEHFSCHASTLPADFIFHMYDSNSLLKSMDISATGVLLESTVMKFNDKHRVRIENQGAGMLHLTVSDAPDLYWPTDDQVIKITEVIIDDCDVCLLNTPSDDEMAGLDFDSDDMDDFDWEVDSDDDVDDEGFMMHMLARQGIFDDADGDRPGWVDYYDEYY